MRKSVLISTAEHTDSLPDGFRWRPFFVTLTYERADQWEPRHISAFIASFRRWMDSHGVPLRAVWVAELQKRGAVHYHLVVWAPANLYLPKFDTCGMWPHGSTNVQRARHPVAYIAKYASKGVGGQDFPKGLRTHSCVGLPRVQRLRRAFLMAPKWLRQAAGTPQRMQRLKGGFVLLHATGELVRSPWVILWRAADWSTFTLVPRSEQ